MSKIYDVIVLGAGPAGLTAGLYAGRSRLSTLIIEKGQDGGQIAITNEIENYPGQQLEGDKVLYHTVILEVFPANNQTINNYLPSL